MSTYEADRARILNFLVAEYNVTREIADICFAASLVMYRTRAFADHAKHAHDCNGGEFMVSGMADHVAALLDAVEVIATLPPDSTLRVLKAAKEQIEQSVALHAAKTKGKVN